MESGRTERGRRVVLFTAQEPSGDAHAAPVIARLAAAAKDAVEQPALKPRLEALGLTPAAEGPATFARFLAAERAEMQALILAEGIRLD